MPGGIIPMTWRTIAGSHLTNCAVWKIDMRID
jgi:hypothetical protein